MEKPLIRQMREQYAYFGGLSLIYGVIFAFCLYRNLSGITFPLCVIVTIIFAMQFMRKIHYTLQRRSLPYMIGMVLLGISTALTTSFFLHFFNLLGIILLFFVFMMHQFYNDQNWNFPAYMERIFLLLGTMIGCIHYPFSHGARYLYEGNTPKKRTAFFVLLGCAIAVAVLSVTLPLLLHSDMVFYRFFGELLKYINVQTIVGVGVMILLGFTLSYVFFGALCKYNFPEGRPRRISHYSPVIGITFTSIISLVYLVYCMIQVTYLFLGVHIGMPEDFTYAGYARSGFGELLFVSFLNFVMVLLCMYLFYENIVLKVVLTIISGCTFIMIFSAGYRMCMYIAAYHLTFLRVLVMWFLIVLALIMVGVVVSIYRKKFPLFYYIMGVVGVLYIGFSLLRPDALVARYNIAHNEELEPGDIRYMMGELSDDIAPVIAQIDLDQDISYTQEDYEYGIDEDLKSDVYDYFADIDRDYEGIYFRKANLSKIRAKLTAQKYMEVHPEYEEDWYEDGWYEENW